MKSIFVILVLFLFLGMISCNPTDDQEVEQNQIEAFDNAGDPPSEETDQNGELDLND